MDAAEEKYGIRITVTNKTQRNAALKVVILAFIAALALPSFFGADTVMGKTQLALTVLCTALAGLLSLVSAEPVTKQAKRWSRRVSLLLMLLLPVATLCMTEFLGGVFIYDWSVQTFIQNYAFVTILYLFAYAVWGNIGMPIIAVNTVFYIFGMVNHFILEFRGTPFLPADIFYIKTGMTVASGYRIMPDNQVALSTALFLLILSAGRYIFLQPKHKAAVCSLRSAGAAALLLFCGVLYGTDWFAQHGMKPDFFSQLRGYTNHGSLFQFVINTKYLKVETPKDYSAEEASDVVEYMLDGNDDPIDAKPLENIVKPTIICVMNETFADLHAVGDFQTNRSYLPFYSTLSENTIRGSVYVPVYGAGTANSEFEFLTGDSLSFLPGGACAYESYIKEDQPSIVSALKAMGYETVAFHPYYGDNWNRDTVYPFLGFDRFIDIGGLLGTDLVDAYRSDKNFPKYFSAVRDRFPNEDVFLRRYVSDSFDYRSVIRMYEDAKRESGRPFFLFNVTMQNHSGYTYYHANFDQEIYLTGDLEGKYPQTDQYLSLIKRSDDALRELIEYYSGVEEPVIICMFGDHQPSIEPEFYEELYGQEISRLSPEEEQAMYQTPFLIWANYDIEEASDVEISLNYLSALLFQTAELPLTEYQQYLLRLQNILPVITTVGYRDRTGQWYRSDDAASPYAKFIEDYRKVQYNHLFDRQNRVERLFSPRAALALSEN